MVLIPGPIMLASYFDKKRSLANGLAFAGSGVGGIMMPHVIAQLIKEYLLHGSLLLLAGFCLNTAVLSSLFRPFKQESKKTELIEQTNEVSKSPAVPPLIISESHQNSENPSPAANLKQFEKGMAYRNKRSYSEDVRQKSTSQETFDVVKSDRVGVGRPSRFLSVTHVPSEPMGERHRHVCRSHPNCNHQHHQHDSLSTWSFSINTTSTMDLPIATEFCVPLEQIQENSGADGEDRPITEELKAFLSDDTLKTKKAKFPLWKRIFYFRNPVTKELSPFIDFAFFKDIRFLLFCIGSALNINYFWVNLITAPRCKQLGLSLEDIAFLASVFAASDTIGRLLCGFIGDRKWLKNHRMSCLIGFCVISGIVTCCNALSNSFWKQLCYMIVCPIFFGGITTFTPVVLGDIVGRQNMAKAWGLMLFFEGFSVVASPVLLGKYLYTSIDLLIDSIISFVYFRLHS